MKRLRYFQLVFMTFVFMILSSQAAIARTNGHGTTKSGFKWTYETDPYELFEKSGAGIAIVGYKGSETNITIPREIKGKTVTTIERYAFENLKKIKSVKIPDTVTQIMDAAFTGCSGLKSLTIPASVTKIETNAFSGCSSLKSVTIKSALCEICKGALGYHKKSSFTIKGYYGSEAEYYASKNGFKFKGMVNDISNVVQVASMNKEIYTYSGKAYKPAFKLRAAYQSMDGGYKSLKKGTDYTVSYSNNVNAGKASVTLTGINHFKGKLTETFLILPKELDVKVKLEKEEYQYTGKQIIPKVTVIQKSSKKTLKKGVDYTVSYSDNIAPGRAGITVKGIKNYTGMASAEFTIRKDKIVIASVPRSVKVNVKGQKAAVKWRKFPKSAGTGAKEWKNVKSIQVQYSTSEFFDKDVVTKKIPKTRTNITLKLKKKTGYYIRVRYLGCKGASEWSSVKKIKTK